jgi:hypothetical protein
MQDQISIVLTGTIITNSILTTYVDSEVRKQEYLRAIHFYTKFAPVYFLENSAYPVENDKEFTSIQNLSIRKMPVSLFYEKGKGYQEFEMIDSWLGIEQDPPAKWFKISGRYIFRNFNSILAECLEDRTHELVIDQTYYHSSANTTMFCITTKYYLQNFKDIYKACDDSCGSYIEIIIFKKLLSCQNDPIRLFASARKIIATGSTGSKINNTGISYYFKGVVRRINILIDRKYIIHPINFSIKEMISNILQQLHSFV